LLVISRWINWRQKKGAIFGWAQTASSAWLAEVPLAMVVPRRFLAPVS